MKPLLEIDSIRALITAARRMVDDLDADGLLPRLLDVLERIVPEDRGVLLDVLEHDVIARTAIDDGNLWGRYKLYPNPFARLYQRTNAPEPAHSLAYEETVHSARMGARMSMTVERTPDWRPNAATLAACDRLSAEERVCIVAISSMIRDRLRARVPR